MRIKGLKTHNEIEGRATCYECLRPKTHCLCQEIRPFYAHTNVLILQHPNEWRKYYSTARLVRQNIKNCALRRGVIFDEGEIARAVGDSEPLLLYPGSNSQDCEDVSLTARHTVIVIDGTWDEAGKIVYRNPMLQTLKRISFHRPLTSRYRIRKQPRQGYLSTIESVAHLLQINAGATGLQEYAELYNRLFDTFDRMIDRQLEHLGDLAASRL